jgi:hypothetical protein
MKRRYHIYNWKEYRTGRSIALDFSHGKPEPLVSEVVPKPLSESILAIPIDSPNPTSLFNQLGLTHVLDPKYY